MLTSLVVQTVVTFVDDDHRIGHDLFIITSKSQPFLNYHFFPRMFVDALDAQMYNQHHGSGRCLLALYEVLSETS